MSLSDPLGDMLARIKNAQAARKTEVVCRASRIRAGVLDVLIREGFLRGYRQDGRDLVIETKYDQGRPAINQMDRVSKPSRRVYSKVSELPRFYNGLGILVVSTPQGILSDREAREKNVGGEILCRVF